MPRKLGTQIEPGIFLLNDGTYEVRTLDEAGGTKSIFVCVGSLPAARALVQRAKLIRKSGRRVSEVLAAERTALGNLQPAGVATIADLAVTFSDQRYKKMIASDHMASGLNKRNNTLRPNSLAAEGHAIKRIVAIIGSVPTTEISRVVVDNFVTMLAAEHLSLLTQDTTLSVLRRMYRSLDRAHRHESFPWRDVRSVKPATPRKRPVNPAKWGGGPTDEPPRLSFLHQFKLAEHVRAADRCLVYLVGVMALRLGEACGVQLQHVTIDAEGEMWLAVQEQFDGELIPWLKSDSSNDRLPVPKILAEYIEAYTERYHDGYSFRTPDQSRALRRLAVTSSGREIDGSFMEASRSAFEARFRGALDSAGLAYDDMGYEITPQHLRRSCASYLLASRAAISEVLGIGDEKLPDPGTNAEVEFLRARYKLDGLSLEPVAATLWLRHSINDAGAFPGASATTIDSYNRPDPTDRQRIRQRAARFLDYVIRCEAGIEALPVDPDKWDEAFVVSPADPRWLRANEAASALDVQSPAVYLALSKGVLTGHRGYFADGLKDTDLVWIIDAESLDRHHAKYEGMSRSGVAELLAINRKSVERLSDVGVLALAAKEPPSYHPEDVVAVYTDVLALVLHAFVGRDEAMSLGAVRRKLVDVMNASADARRIFPNPPKVGPVQVKKWLDDLYVAGAVKRVVGGNYRVIDSNGAERAARDAAASAGTRQRPGKPPSKEPTARQVEVMQAVGTTRTLADAAKALNMTSQGVLAALERAQKGTPIPLDVFADRLRAKHASTHPE